MKRREILLVNPWIHDFAAYDLWARPLGLLVLATELRRQGWEVRLVDCLDHDHPGMEPPKLRSHSHGRFHRTPIPKPPQLEHIPRTYSRYGVDPHLVETDLSSMRPPAAILVTGLMTYWYPGVQEAISLLKKVFPGVPVLLGGVYASLIPRHAAAYSGADEVVPGPGEDSVSDTLSRKTGRCPDIKVESSGLQFTPALDLLTRVRFLPVLTSRGCPFTCAYCASRKLIPRHVRRGPGDVLREIEQAWLRYGFTDVALYDDAFLVNAESHALPLLESVAERIPGLKWHSPNGLHASAVTPTVARAMHRAGFETIRLGLESSSDQFHVQTGGKTTKQEFLTAVCNLRDAGFTTAQIGVYLLVGLPGQSGRQIEDDVELVMRAGATPKLAEYSPIPGTSMWRTACQVRKYPIAEEPLYHNCTLLPAAEPEVDWTFLQRCRRRIRQNGEAG